MNSNQNEYLGWAIVAFVDILGISAALSQSWGPEPDTALQRFLRVKNAYPGVKSNPKTMFKISDPERGETVETMHSQVRTLSDSVVILSALPPSTNEITVESFNIRVFDVFVCLGHIWQTAINEGFTIRGAVEIGQIYWNDEDFTGQGLIKTYNLESKVAESSRIILGPDLLTNLVNASKADPRIDTPLNALVKSSDGLLMLNPNFLLKPKNRDQLIDIQCKSGQFSLKYTELIEKLENGGEKPRMDEIEECIKTLNVDKCLTKKTKK
jgi:hypothetical protein